MGLFEKVKFIARHLVGAGAVPARTDRKIVAGGGSGELHLDVCSHNTQFRGLSTPNLL